MATQKKASAAGRSRSLDSCGLEKVIALLRASTGRDFSLYKKSTLARRVERRMAAVRAKSAAAYLRLLEEGKGEAKLLLNDLLIGVTRFYREPEAWERLKAKGLPELIAARPKGGTLRAWVPACSTGEEAYTLAMVFLETAEKLKPRRAIPYISSPPTSMPGPWPGPAPGFIPPPRLRRPVKPG